MIAALTDAVRDLEQRSCAEVVVEVRSRSGSYAHAESRFGALIAFATLLLVVFSPWTFAPGWVVIDVAIVYFAGVWIARKSDTLRRWMSTPRERAAQVRTTAASLFFERGVANTERETGVLVLLSLLERRLEILADRGVLSGVPALEWNRLIDVARARTDATPATLLETLRALEPLLAQHMPVRDGDRDELPNAPWVGCE